MTNKVLDKTVELFWRACPTLAKRQDIAIRSFVKYQQLLRNKPLPIEQVHTDTAEAAEKALRSRERWKRNLGRYKRLYQRTRFPWDPKL